MRGAVSAEPPVVAVVIGVDVVAVIAAVGIVISVVGNIIPPVGAVLISIGPSVGNAALCKPPGISIAVRIDVVSLRAGVGIVEGVVGDAARIVVAALAAAAVSAAAYEGQLAVAGDGIELAVRIGVDIYAVIGGVVSEVVLRNGLRGCRGDVVKLVSAGIEIGSVPIVIIDPGIAVLRIDRPSLSVDFPCIVTIDVPVRAAAVDLGLHRCCEQRDGNDCRG